MKYKYLEYLRASAALAVFINHIVGKLPYFEKHRTALFQSISNWGTESVIIFFLLSGVVINHTVKKYSQNRPIFLKKRAIRILPIYYSCLLLAIGVDYITNYHSSTIYNYWGTFFFVATLQGLLVYPIFTITVVWSLSFEVFFYLFYSLTIGKNQSKLLLGWFTLSLICVYFYYVPIENNILRYFVLMFSYSSIWLCGYFIYEYKNLFKTNFPTAIFSFSMIPLVNRLQISPNFFDLVTFLVMALLCVPIFIFALSCGEKNNSKEKAYKLNHWHYLPIYLIGSFLSIIFSKSLLISRIFYLSIPIISLVLLDPKVESAIKQMLRSWEKVMLYIASISYALYLIHMPIIFLFSRLMPTAVLPSIILIFLFSFSSSTFLEHSFQKKVNSFFKKS